jgi:hypothetical protein
MDGGRNQIVGLLYELLVVQRLLTDGILVNDASNSLEFDGFTLGALLTGDDAQLLHQYCDTDVAVCTPNSISVVQCKASANAAKVTQSDIRQILVEAAKHVSKIRESGDKRTIAGLYLVTNRPLSDELAGKLQGELATIAGSDPKCTACPACLTKPAKQPTIEGWCLTLTHQTSTNGAKTTVRIPADLAKIAQELLLRLKVVQLSMDGCASAFDRSMRRLGLTSAEASSVASNLAGEIITAAKNHEDIAGRIKRNLFGAHTFHSLCPCDPDLGAIHRQHIDDLQQAYDLPPVPDPEMGRYLPRRRLVSEVIGAMSAPGTRVVVLRGDGGMGKSHLLLRLPEFFQGGASASAVSFIALAARKPTTGDYLRDALSPYFEGNEYIGDWEGGVLLTRLVNALKACGEPSPIRVWVFVPDADELCDDDLKTLLDQVRDAPSSARFVITCRTHNWPSDQRFSQIAGLLTCDIGLLDREELYQWFAARGASAVVAHRPSLLGGSNWTQPTGFRSRDAVDCGYLDHPLAFGALATWYASISGQDPLGSLGTQYDLQQLLDANRTALAAFMRHARSYYCTRVRKHVQADLDDIEMVFNRLWAARDALPSTSFGTLHDELNKDLPTPNADEITRQFMQVGIVRRRDTGPRYFEWAIPYVGDLENVDK